MSSRRLQDMSSKHLEDMSSRRLQDVFSATIFLVPRRLQDQQMFAGMMPRDTESLLVVFM